MKKRTRTSLNKTRTHSTGAVAANPHEGSRSEVPADYLFSGWGTVTPVRRQDDFGIDLYCTLTETRGQRAVVTDYFVVEVKSTNEPWRLYGTNSVKWLVEYPQPLFLAWIDKREGILRLYHVTPRFTVGTLPPLPDRLELTMEDSDNGSPVEWTNGTQFSLSAPILRICIADLLDEARTDQLRVAFTDWVRIDAENCNLFRDGLLRHRMPASYRVNERPSRAIAEVGCRAPDVSQIALGILTAAEGAECIGGQLGIKGDRAAALYSAMFVDHLRKKYPTAFQGQPRWGMGRLPADLGQVVCQGLDRILPSVRYLWEGFDTVVRALLSDQRVRAFLGDEDVAPDNGRLDRTLPPAESKR